jgi:diguanylate cyclase (GGDEF)-like protein
VVLLAGASALAIALMSLGKADSASELSSPSLWVFLAAAALAHAFPVIAPRHQAYHATQAFLMASVLLLSWPAVALIVLAIHAVEWLRRRRPWFIQLYNLAVSLLSMGAGMACLNAFGGQPFAFADPRSLLAAIAAAAAMLVINHGLTAVVLKLARGVSFAASGLFGRESLGLDGTLLLVGIAIAGAWQIQPLAVAISAAPLMLIPRALRMANVEEASRRDAITGRYNTRPFLAALDLEIRRARRLSQDTGVMVAVVDDMPVLVQRFGRATLDSLMLALADRLTALVGDHEAVARLGEGTLGVLLPDTEADTASLIAKRISDAVAAQTFGVPTTREPVAATISAAVVSVPPETSTAADVLANLERFAVRAALSGPRALHQPELTPPAVVTQRATSRELAPSVVPPGGAPSRWSNLPVELSLFEALVIGPAVALTVWVATRSSLPELSLVGGIVAFVLVTELLGFELYDRSSFSISFVPILAAGLLGGAAATLLATWSVALARGILRRSRWDKVLFNGAAFSLFGLAATWIASAGGGLSTRASELTVLIVATLFASATYYFHTFLIAGALALDLGADPRVVWDRNFRWLFPHYLVLGAMGLGLAVATVELGPLGSALFLAPPLMMRFVVKQYTERTAGAVERLEAANAELIAASALLRRRGEELALLSDLGQLAASEPRAASLPSLVASRCVSAVGDVCAVVWRGLGSPERAVFGLPEAHAVVEALRGASNEQVQVLGAGTLEGKRAAWVADLGGHWYAAPLLGADQHLGWILAWRANLPNDDERAGRLKLMREVARRLALVLERDALLEEAATVDALRAVDRAKSDFIATTAHELRTPLTSLQGYAELLRSDVEPGLRDRWLRIVHGEAAQLAQVLDQLLDVSRLDSDRFRAERRAFDLSEVVERVLEAFRDQAALSGHRFECELAPGLPRGFADPAQIERVLRNLLSNALKYAPNGGVVRLVAASRSSVELEVCVEDEGMGIPPEWLGRLFERFQRVDLPERASIRGTGLGLYIARQLVELNGGRIWAASDGAGMGASFHFTLAFAPRRRVRSAPG